MTIKAYIQRYITLKITSGEWEKKMKIPSENMFANKFQCSRITARNALVGLVNAGYLRSEKGKGYIVSSDSKENSLMSFNERYEVNRGLAKAFPIELNDELKEMLEVQPNDRVVAFRKMYHDKNGVIAEQITLLNNEYIWDKNYEGFATSITEELAKQGIAINETRVEVRYGSKKFLDQIAKDLGFEHRYPMEIVYSWYGDAWIEKTVRIVRADKFRVVYRKKKY